MIYRCAWDKLRKTGGCFRGCWGPAKGGKVKGGAAGGNAPYIASRQSISCGAEQVD